MADKLAIMAELAKRGKLPPDKAALFAEAQKRGLVPGGGPSPAIKAGQDIAYAGQYDNQKPPPNLLDAMLATVNGMTSSVPFLQQASDALVAGGQTAGDILTGQDSRTPSDLIAGKPGGFMGHYNDIQASRKVVADKAPLANVAGQLAPLVVAPMLAPEAAGLAGSFGQRLLNSTASSAGYEGLQGLSHGHTGGELLADEGLGGLGGAAGAVAGKAIEKTGAAVADALTSSAQNKLTKSAIVGAPDAAGLKNASRALFKSVDDAGVTVDTPKFTGLVATLAAAAKKDHINETLDPKAFAVYRQLVGILGEAESGVRPLTLSDLHTIRQIAQQAAVSTEGRDAMFAGRIVDGLDSFISQGGALNGGKDAGNNLLKAISTWGRAKRVGLIEEAVTKARNQASGVENGLRTQFRAILQDPKKRKLFTAIELKAVKQVANGTSLSNATRLLGMFGFDFGSGRNMVGGSIGALIGGIPLVIAGSLARKGSEKLATAGANRVAKIVATPNIPVAPQVPNLLLPGAKPISLLIRGGASLPVTANP